MGGHSFKSTQRLSKTEFEFVSKSIVNLLSEAFPNSKNNIIKSYESKYSFGDVDVLTNINILDIVKFVRDSNFQTNINEETVNFSNSVSILYDGKYQVDVITVEDSHYNFSYDYLNYNVLSSLIGIVSRMCGIKLKTTGLYYVASYKEYTKDILISENYDDALFVLDYDVNAYRRGFIDIEDIYNYVVSTKYFNKYLFILENRSNGSRSRDIKRELYIGFLKYLNNSKNLIEYPWTKLPKGVYETNSQNKEILDLVFDKFPNVRKDIENFHTECDIKIEKRKLKEERIFYIKHKLNLSDSDFNILCRNLALSGVNISNLITSDSIEDILRHFNSNTEK